MKFWQYVVIAALIFVCMYDPKSGGLERYGQMIAGARSPGECCDPAVGRGCQARHYQSIQFAEPNQSCPLNTPQAKGGAIFQR